MPPSSSGRPTTRASTRRSSQSFFSCLTSLSKSPRFNALSGLTVRPRPSQPANPILFRPTSRLRAERGRGCGLNSSPRRQTRGRQLRLLRLKATEHRFQWAEPSQAALVHASPDASSKHHFHGSFLPSLAFQDSSQLLVVLRHKKGWAALLAQQLIQRCRESSTNAFIPCRSTQHFKTR